MNHVFVEHTIAVKQNGEKMIQAYCPNCKKNKQFLELKIKPNILKYKCACCGYTAGGEIKDEKTIYP